MKSVTEMYRSPKEPSFLRFAIQVLKYKKCCVAMKYWDGYEEAIRLLKDEIKLYNK